MNGPAQSQIEKRSGIAQALKDPYLAILLLAPLYLLFASSSWIFSTPLNIDGWVYHGYFRNLQEYKTVLFPGTYYGTRLSAILPGYVAYTILPPLVANYVLHLSLWYASAFAAYSLLKTTAGREAALIGSLFLCSSTFFLQSIGWDYIDGPATAYFIVCLAFVTAAACRGSRLAMALGGALFAAVVYANLFTIVFAPVVAVYFVLLSYRAQNGHLTLRARAWSLVWFLSGSAALTVLLALVNFFIEGRFLFYLPSIQYVLTLAAKPNSWKRPVSEWVSRADSLTPYMLTLMPLMWVGRRMANLIANFRGGRSANDLASREITLTPIVNGLLQFCLSHEIPRVVERRGLPFGSSLLAVARKLP